MKIKNKKLKFGITGGIASGKSTVAQILRQMGYAVIDADQVSRELTKKDHPVLQKIVQKFGLSILTSSGELDRQALRKIIFDHQEKRLTLEEILHPEILKRSREKMTTFLAQGHEVVFYEASLLFESGRESEFDGVLVVTSSISNQINRLLARDRTLNQEQALNIIQAQTNTEDKVKKANWVIENNSDIVSLENRVKSWIKTLSLEKIS